MIERLPYTAVTSSGNAYDIRFPLHPETRSPERVSHLISSTLEAISRDLESGSSISDGDVLQALSMALAIRARLVDASPGASLRLMHELVDSAFAAALEARCYRAGRA
ncbi:MAG: hypothetical protein ACM3ST_07710 [Bdellovibrio bacteriovorus]